AAARHPHGDRPADPAGAASGTDADLRSDILGIELRLQARAQWTRPWSRGYLGYTLTRHKLPKLTLAKVSLQRLMQRVREILKRGKGRNIRRVIEELTPVLRGWASYFSLVDVKRPLEAMDGWIRRRLRCVIWWQWKRP
ncbi:group II intron maturase-specific domain-containing protein, partial [Halomonas sp. 15WGF]